jgi:hypothetical protein
MRPQYTKCGHERQPIPRSNSTAWAPMKPPPSYPTVDHAERIAISLPRSVASLQSRVQPVFNFQGF